MSYNKHVIGQGTCDGFIAALSLLDIPFEVTPMPQGSYYASPQDDIQTPLRLVKYTKQNGEVWCAEEYVAYQTIDCDADDSISVFYYLDGHRPKPPETVILDADQYNDIEETEEE